VKAARRCSSVGAAWLALAFYRSLRASITSCIAWLGMSASPLAWAARLIWQGWRFGGRTSQYGPTGAIRSRIRRLPGLHDQFPLLAEPLMRRRAPAGQGGD
jgi:hypothetical protein